MRNNQPSKQSNNSKDYFYGDFFFVEAKSTTKLSKIIQTDWIMQTVANEKFNSVRSINGVVSLLS